MACRCGNKKKCTCSDTGCQSSGKTCESFDGGFSGVNGCNVYYSGCPVDLIRIKTGQTFDHVVKILVDEMFKRDCEYDRLIQAYDRVSDSYDQLSKKYANLQSVVDELKAKEETV